MTNFLKSTIAAVILAVAGVHAHAGPVRESLSASDTRGEISFRSVGAHASRRDIRAVGKLELDAEISGTISFPGVFGTNASAANKVPAVVLMHGSNGPNKSVKAWADYLNGIGVATFTLDYFTGRGIQKTMEDQSQIGQIVPAIDALLALRLLASHPFIDAQRIAVMGFSKGGTSAQVASFKVMNELVLGKESPLQFAGHLAFYGGCAAAAQTTGAPILMLVGEAEDYIPLANCRHAYKVMKMKGANIQLVTYPGAYHGFDTGNKIVFHPNFQTTAACRSVEDYDSGRFYVPNSANPMQAVGREDMLRHPCDRQQRGAHTGGDPAAARAAKDEVTRFVKTYLQR